VKGRAGSPAKERTDDGVSDRRIVSTRCGRPSRRLHGRPPGGAGVGLQRRPGGRGWVGMGAVASGGAGDCRPRVGRRGGASSVLSISSHFW
jgi:hypothetical protein